MNNVVPWLLALISSTPLPCSGYAAAVFSDGWESLGCSLCKKERMLYFGWAVRSKADMLPATDRAERRNVILMVRSVKLKKSTSG